ncbi:MAG: GDSL-type esterase/lipase family protein [Desulfobaccales bacterium]
MNQTPQPKRENWFQQNPKKTLALVTGMAILLIVFAAEKILQFHNHRHGVFLETEPRYIKLTEYRPLTSFMLPFPQDQQPFTDKVFIKKHPLNVDNDGFIRPSRKYAQPDLSLAFLGGSTTECMYVDEENRFPFVAGGILEQETGKKINSYNGGMSGINTLNCIDILVNKVIPLKPRVVVFMENINDLSTLLYEGTYWNKNTWRSPIQTVHKKESVSLYLKEIFIPNLTAAYKNLTLTVLQGQQDQFAAYRGKKLQVDKGKLNQEFAMNLQTIVEICKIRGIIPVLMTQANRITDRPDPVVETYVTRFGEHSGLDYRDFKEIYDSFNATIRQVGRRNQVLVIDLATEIPPDKTYLYDLVHFNDTGSRYAAGLIAARLKSVLASEVQRDGHEIP